MLTQTFSRALGSSQLFARSAISLRQLLATDVHRCLALQDTLTEAEKKFISIRSGDEFKELTGKGVMMGAFVGDRLVAQSGTNLVSADHDYIVFEEATGMSAMPKRTLRLVRLSFLNAARARDCRLHYLIVFAKGLRS